MKASQFLQEVYYGRNRQWGWYLLTLFCVFGAFVIGQGPLSMMITRKQQGGQITGEDLDNFNSTADFSFLGIDPILGLVLLLIGFVLALAVLWLIVHYVHQRPFFKLVRADGIAWKKVLFGFVLWFGLTAMCEGIAYIVNPGSYTFDFHPGRWLLLMTVVLVLLPLQTSLEELLVRGYLLQRLAILPPGPWVGVLVTTIFFAGMHLGNPEIREFGTGIMMFYYCSVGVALAVITILDDGLEYALGIHAATNIYGAGFVSYEGSALQTDAFIKVGVVDPVLMVVLFYISIIAFYLIAGEVNGLGSWRKLISPVNSPESEPMQVTVDINPN